MNRNNHLRTQFISTLNPDNMYQLPINHDKHKNNRIQYEDQSQYGSIKIKTQTTTQERGKFLSLVSKPNKSMKKHKNSKKMLLKKSHSVILGGNKKSINTTNKSEQSSLKSSRCKSCTNFHQTNQNPLIITQTVNKSPSNTILPQKNIPIMNITSQQSNNNNQQLTKIINHKLKMDTVQPYQFFTQRIYVGEQNNNIGNKFDRKLLRNMSAGSMGRVYFSVGSGKREQVLQRNNDKLNLIVEKPQLTPRFDKTDQKDQRKRRQRAGFIRSASAKKASPPHYQNRSPTKHERTSSFQHSQTSYQPEQQNNQTPKQQQIDQCISKMSLIRKQINQIQLMIHQRLQSSQLRSKLMYGTRDSLLNSTTIITNNNEQSNNLFTHRQYQSNNNNLQNIKNYNRRLSTSQLSHQSSTTTIVNNLNDISRQLITSKCALVESGKCEQIKNVISSNNKNNHNNKVMNLHDICKLVAHPQTIMSQQLVQKQFLRQFSTSNTPSRTVSNYNNNNDSNLIRHKLNNQQNITISNNTYHKNNNFSSNHIIGNRIR